MATRAVAVSDQIHRLILDPHPKNPSLRPAIRKMEQFIQAKGFFAIRTARKEAKEAIFRCIDDVSKGKFSSLLATRMNSVAHLKYCEYQKSVEDLLDNLKAPPANYDVCKEINQIGTIVLGSWGVIQSAYCANFFF